MKPISGTLRNEPRKAVGLFLGVDKHGLAIR